MRVLIPLLVLSACPVEPEPVLPPGCLRVNRTLLEFGGVRVGDTHDIVVLLTNDCEEAGAVGPVSIESVQFDRGAPAFSTPPPTSTHIARGESAFLQVAFRPPALGDYTDALQIRSNAREDANVSIDITGSGAGPELEVEASAVHVGAPLVGCTGRVPLRLTNNGGAPLRLSGFRSDHPGFGIALPEGQPFPLDIPGRRGTGAPPYVDVDVLYRPVETALDEGTITLFSDDPAAPETAVTVTGEGTFYEEQRDPFVFDAYADSDLLFSLSRAASMDDNLDDVRRALATYAGRLAELDDAFHVALVVADDGCVLGPDRWIDNTFSAAEAEAALLTMADLDFELSEPGAGTEAGLDRLMIAQEPTNTGIGQCNEGVFRPGHRRFLVPISDSPDKSEFTSRHYAETWRPPGDPDPLFPRLHAIVGPYPDGCPTAQVGSGYLYVASHTLGAWHPICDDAWGGELIAPSFGPVGYATFPLTRTPVAESVELWLHGSVPAGGWNYGKESNSVYVQDRIAPPYGTELEIRYAVQPDCEE